MAVTPRSSLLDSLGWVDYAFQIAGAPPPDNAAYGHQRHSAKVVSESQNIPPKSCESDGVIGTGPRPVAVYTADCLPVLIADNNQKTVAAVHAGLKGTLAGVLYQAVEQLCARGATPASLYVAIGPAIAPCCYELGENMLAEIAQLPEVPQPLPWHRSQPVNPQAQRPQAIARQQGIWFDLPSLARQMLIKVGVPATQIENINLCTYCMAEPGSSYRFNSHFNSGYQSRYSWIRRADLTAS
jgi:YfiH family protein